MRRSCAVFAGRGAEALLSRRAVWAGQVRDWQPACAALEVIGDQASARAVIEALFVPVAVEPASGESRFTGYFEPSLEARLVPEPPFTDGSRAPVSSRYVLSDHLWGYLQAYRDKHREKTPLPVRRSISPIRKRSLRNG